MRTSKITSLAEARSPRWLRTLGYLIERFGIWPAIGACTALTVATSILLTLTFAMFVMPADLSRSLVMAALIPMVITSPISFAMFRLIEDLSLTRKALRQIAHHDGLTQAYTRRFFMTAVTAPLRSAPTRLMPDSIVLLDIDDFKRINDEFGHLFGDSVLQAVSDTCRQQLRTEDLFARFGGEEFVILIADASPDLTRAVAERIRKAVADLVIQSPSGNRIFVTASLGVAHQSDRVRGVGSAILEQALGFADEALYTAKRKGKNRFEFVSFGGAHAEGSTK